MRPTRRQVLKTGALGLALSAIPAWARDAFARAAAPPPDLIERNAWPEHWETTVAGLGRARNTPNEAFFVRSHFPVPAVDAASWKLEIKGLVDRPRALDLAALRAMPQRPVRATLECAGNGRGLYDLANTSGTQWGLGAVGTAEWRGVALATLLDQAGVQAGAKHVWFEAADHATLPQAPPFLRSIPLDLARERATIALDMNGRPLPALHGGPARALVPGWYGMAWAKWVTRIRIEAAPSDNHFMVKGYRYVAPGGDPLASPPVEAMRVKSLITSPLDGAHVAGRSVEVKGWAWTGTGSGRVMTVEVSSDGGATWQNCTLEVDAAPYAWQQFTARVPAPRPGPLTLIARASDARGAQPLAAQPNVGGYGNNSAHRVTVHATG
jgi:DMSO/TMAO reductase YedYZ molybdopterin-dependent catalytic subunit